MIRLLRFLLPVMLGFTIATAQAGAGDVVVIEIVQYEFSPREVTVTPGTLVRWVNLEKRQFHNVWFKEAGEAPGEYLFPGDEYERVFDQPGDYPYVCQPHEARGMTGKIIVAE